MILFRREIYHPLLEAIGLKRTALSNSIDVLFAAITSGRIQFDRGKFSGKFTAAISREMRALGAKWNKQSDTWDIPINKMPPDLRVAVAGSESRFDIVLDRLNEKLQQIFPEKIADLFQGEKLFDTALWRLDQKIGQSIKGITVAPDLTKQGRAEIARDYTKNMQLYIQDFTHKEISKLRGQIQEKAFAGNRYDAIQKMIQRSYDVSANKAKFLARQETSILMAKFKKARYTEAGLDSYVWGCVNMPHDKTPKQHTVGNVRYSHGHLEGKTFRWDSPPVTTNPGQPSRKNNPGEDYGCRCFARPVVRFDK